MTVAVKNLQAIIALLFVLACFLGWQEWKEKRESHSDKVSSKNTDSSREGSHRVEKSRPDEQSLEPLFELLASSSDEGFKRFLRSWLMNEALRTENFDLLEKVWLMSPVDPELFSVAAQLNPSFALEELEKLTDEKVKLAAWQQVI